MAAVMTTAMVLSLTIYAIKTKTDFTMMGGALFIVSYNIFKIEWLFL